MNVQINFLLQKHDKEDFGGKEYSPPYFRSLRAIRRAASSQSVEDIEMQSKRLICTEATSSIDRCEEGGNG